MDSFCEQLVKKQNSMADYLKVGGLALGALALSVFLFTAALVTNFMVLIVLGVLILVGSCWLITGMSTEYEYIVTNTDLDIDKIMGKRQRKRLITLKLPQAEQFGVYTGNEGDGVQATVIATDGTGVNAYYLIANHKTHGKTMLVFSPDKRTVTTILDNLPHKVKTAAKLHFNEKDNLEE